MTTGNAKTDPEVQAFFRPEMVQTYQSAAPVSAWAINVWCNAMGDQNPVYQDPEAARRYGHRDVFAPPVMMHSFTMPGVVGESEGSMLAALRGKLAPFGIDSVVAANYGRLMRGNFSGLHPIDALEKMANQRTAEIRGAKLQVAERRE